VAARGKKITTRWLTGSLGIIFVIVVFTVVAFAMAVRTFYYNSAEQTVTAQANTVSTLLTKYADDPSLDYTREVRNLIENFDGRDSMELMALDADGNVATTSSGFEIASRMEMPDFDAAMAAQDGVGRFRGKIGGENVVAVTMRAPASQEQPAAVRVIASLASVDRLVRSIVLVTAALGTAILFFTVISGLYFIRSIVIPVGEIGKIARNIAHGDFNVRLEKKNDDEIGDLCETINDMAEELGTAERMKNDFISSVSHELRTPMTAIRGWGETINTAPEDTETVKKGMRIILSETDRLSQMVEELLEFSRLQSGRLKLNFEKIDLLAELEEAVETYAKLARSENIALDYEEQIDLAVVIADRFRMREVFINIIDNAIKYSDAGGSVRVTAGAEDDWIVIRVADRGCGISPEDLPRIKQKFYKANLTRRGSGIGLALSDGIVTSHRGTLDVESELGVGTTVTIRIPTAKRYEQLAAQEEQARASHPQKEADH